MPPAPTDAPSSDAPRLQRAQAEEHGPWAPTGPWTALGFTQPQAWAALERALQESQGPQAGASQAWDLRGLTKLDHIGAQLLWRHWGGQWPGQLTASDSQRAVLDQVARLTLALPPEPHGSFVDGLRHQLARLTVVKRIARDALTLVGQLILDLGTLLRDPRRAPWRDISGHLYNTGATALSITALVGVLIGVVLAYLMANQLRNFGAESFVVNILGLSLIRELGPVLAAVLIAGRSGSAMTAQIGVMRVTEELDAMRVMGIAHGYRLVMPRVIALAIAMPLVNLWTTAAALAGGMVAAELTLDISPAFFIQQLPRAVPFSNIVLATVKSAVFGVLIALIACHHGMRVKPNTESLGRGTTSSVVTSITVVIVVDAIFAVLFRGVGFRA